LKIQIPEISSVKPIYYTTFFRYVRRLFKDAGCEIELVNENWDCHGNSFFIKVGSEKVVIDYSDHSNRFVKKCKHIIFKLHYNTKLHGKHSHIKPFPPVSFYDWERFDELRKKIKYNKRGKKILCNQKPGGNAESRRWLVRKMLIDTFDGKWVDFSITPQDEYWLKVNDALVHVFVPGARNDMIDRGHMQYMAFGCCCICPPITDELPGVKLESGVHYIPCKPDYSDLISVIRWCSKNRDECLYAGRRCAKIFREHCMPKPVLDMVLKEIS